MLLSLTALALALTPLPQDAAMVDEQAEWIAARTFRDLVFLPASIDGASAEGLLDSGASITCIDAGVAQALELGEGQEVQVQGAGGMDTALLYQGLTLELGGKRIELEAVLALDLTETASHLGRPVELVLGQDLFRRFVVDVDYPRSRVALRDPEGFEYVGPGQALALQRTSTGLFSLELGIEAQEPARFLVDTGMMGTLELHGDYVRRQGLLDQRSPRSTTLGGGVGGMQLADLASLEFLAIGEAELGGVPAAFGRDAGSEELAGILGSSLLKRFRLLFVPGREQLILETTAERLAAPFERDHLGLQTVHTSEGLEVLHVRMGSPAARAGWEAGQRIAAIDGVEVGSEAWDGLGAWSSATVGSQVRLLDGEGQLHTLRAAEFY